MPARLIEARSPEAIVRNQPAFARQVATEHVAAKSRATDDRRNNADGRAEDAANG